MRKRRHNLGFTLIELIMVMIIIVILVMAAEPALSRFTRGRLLSSSSSLLSTTARWCQVEAVSYGLSYRLNFSPDGTSWWVTRDDGSGLNFTEVKDKVLGTDTYFTPDLAQKFTLPEGVTLEFTTLTPNPNDGLLYVSFDASGRTDPQSFRLHQDENYTDVVCETQLSKYHVVAP